MKYIWILSASCICAMSCGCKPDSTGQAAAPSAQSDAEKKMSDFIREERIREIEVSKKRIEELLATLADLEKNDESESEQDISFKITGNRFAHTGFKSSSENDAYLQARSNYLASKLDRIEKAKERINKEVAELRIHLRSLLNSESKSSPAVR
jgi:chaperonin cofactor prefoldin